MHPRSGGAILPLPARKGIGQALLECATWQIFHHEERDAILLAKIKYFDNIRVVEFSKRLGFALEAFQDALERSRGELVNPDNLDCHIPFKASIVGLIHCCHTAFAELFEDFGNVPKIGQLRNS